jgi:hypothetical protein
MLSFCLAFLEATGEIRSDESLMMLARTLKCIAILPQMQVYIMKHVFLLVVTSSLHLGPSSICLHVCVEVNFILRKIMVSKTLTTGCKIIDKKSPTNNHC